MNLSLTGRNTKAALLALAFIATTFSLQFLVDSTTPSRSKESRPEMALEQSGQMLGGLRSGLAAYLWLRTEEIHHTYYENLSKEQELIPFYRIMTWLDPHFILAYDVGSYTLTLYGKNEEGLKFIKEGLEKNPDSPTLNLTAGQIYLFRFRDFDNAIRYFKTAIRLESDPKAIVVYRNYLNLARRVKNRRPRSGSSSVPKQPPSVPWKLFAD